MIKVTYLGHSGFLAEMEDVYLLFDYYKGELPETDPDKKMAVFVSHAHYDHYNKNIFSLRDRVKQIRFILSDDVPGPDEDDVLFVRPNERKEILGLHITTLRSNDEGVAFLVKNSNKTIYHAGDLNWWHWEGEPDAYNTKMRRSYQSEINKLQKEKIDVAFVPVDPRLGEQYCWGLDCFMKRTETAKVFPMHFWDTYDIFDRLFLEKCTEDYQDRIVRIDREGQTFLLEEQKRKKNGKDMKCL